MLAAASLPSEGKVGEANQGWVAGLRSCRWLLLCMFAGLKDRRDGVFGGRKASSVSYYLSDWLH